MLFRYLVGLMLSSFAVASYAQDWKPVRPIKVVVPYAPGGPADIAARLISNKMQQFLGQPVIIENKAGAGTVVGASAVWNATPDGYTLLLATSTTLSIAPLIQEKLPFVAGQFVPVAGVEILPFLVNVTKGLPVNSLKDLIAYSRSNPGVVNYGTLGQGTSNYILGTILSIAAGETMTPIHYTSGSPALLGLMRGDIHIYFDGTSSSLHRVSAGEFKAIGVTSPVRVPSAGSVPTVSEEGHPELTLSVWYGLVAPPGTPASVVTTLNSAVRTAISDPETAMAMARDGAQPISMGPGEFREFIRNDAEAWKKAVLGLPPRLR